MRVIAGKAKGQNLKSNSSREARPTTDRVKEALFNILGPEIIDIDLLDLYAGFGGLGIEALSRGAKSATFIEESPQQLKIIEQNLQLTGFRESARVIAGDVLSKLNFLDQQSFDIIIMDPPYHSDLVWSTVEQIMELDLLKRAGVIVIEQHRDSETRENLPGLKLIRDREYGNTKLSLYLKKDEGG